MQNVLFDPQAVQSYHNEYLNLIKYYMNVKRPSSFVRYYNIDLNNSSYDDKLEATYDLYTVSNIKFNVYEFTPTYYLAPIVNAATNVPDTRGQQMDAASSIVVYTVTPRIHDVLTFYSPVKSGEVFRVTGLRTPVNAIYTDANLNWFELELEYAPISDVGSLKVLNHYVYDLSEEKYITYEQYQTLLKNLNEYEKILKQMINFYDGYYDVYQSENLVPIEVNEVLIHFKRMYGVKYKRLLEDYYFPYGYLDIVGDQMFYPTVNNLPYVMGNYTYHVYNLITREYMDYTWSITRKTSENELDRLFLLSYQLLQVAFNWEVK